MVSWFLTEMWKAISGERIVFSTKKAGHPCAKLPSPYLILYHHPQIKRDPTPKYKMQTLKFLEENKKILWLRVRQDFLGYRPCWNLKLLPLERFKTCGNLEDMSTNFARSCFHKVILKRGLQGELKVSTGLKNWGGPRERKTCSKGAWFWKALTGPRNNEKLSCHRRGKWKARVSKRVKAWKGEFLHILIFFHGATRSISKAEINNWFKNSIGRGAWRGATVHGVAKKNWTLLSN